MRQARWLIGGIVLGTAIVSSLATYAIATHETGHSEVVGTGITEVRAVRSDSIESLRSPTSGWQELDPMRTKITIPEGQRAFVLARFSADSVCFTATYGYCFVRILIGGAGVTQELHPSDSNSSSSFEGEGVCTPGCVDAEGTEAAMIERSSDVLDPGTYTVRVQWKVEPGTNPGPTTLTFVLEDMHLTVERVTV